MSRLYMYLPSRQFLRTGRSETPLIGSKMTTKLSIKSLLRDPKTKNNTNNHSPNCSSSVRLSESPNIKNTITKIKKVLSKLTETTQTIILPSIKSDEKGNRTAEEYSNNGPYPRLSKSANRLKFAITAMSKEKDLESLPRYKTRNLIIRRANKLKKKLKLKKKTDVLSDNENLCGWETESIICESG